MPLMEDTYCNPEDIPWEYFYGHIREVLTDPAYRKGRFVLLFPPIQGDLTKGYRPEDHQSKEQVREGGVFLPIFLKKVSYFLTKSLFY